MKFIFINLLNMWINDLLSHCFIIENVLLTNFYCLLTSFSICNQVICKEYAISHFPRETMYITLQSPDKSKEWHPRYYIRKDKSTYILRGQWFNFVRDNHVQEGDICLLLPTKSRRKFKLTIYLLRATATNSKGGTVSRTCFQRPDPCHARSSGKIASAVNVKEESTDGIIANHNNLSDFRWNPFLVSQLFCLFTLNPKSSIV